EPEAGGDLDGPAPRDTRRDGHDDSAAGWRRRGAGGADRITVDGRKPMRSACGRRGVGHQDTFSTRMIRCVMGSKILRYRPDFMSDGLGSETYWRHAICARWMSEVVSRRRPRSRAACRIMRRETPSRLARSPILAWDAFATQTSAPVNPAAESLLL